MKDDKFSISYLYSFMLTSFNIGSFVDIKEKLEFNNLDIKQKIIDEFEKGPYKLIRNDNDIGGEIPVVHMSEEIVPPLARLPFYYRFPHISLKYNIGTWKVQKIKRKEDNVQESVNELTEVDLNINLFVFEYGAGLLSINANSEFNVGDNLSSLLSAFDFPNCNNLNGVLKESSAGFYTFTPLYTQIDKTRDRYKKGDLTLHEIFQTEKTNLIKVLKDIFKDDEKDKIKKDLEQFEQTDKYKTKINESNYVFVSNIICNCLEAIEQFKKIESVDKYVYYSLTENSFGHSDYYQNPFTIVDIEINDFSKYGTEGINNLLRIKISSDQTERYCYDKNIPIRFKKSHLWIGSKGAILFLPKDEIDKYSFSQLSPYIFNLKHILFRVVGSIRIAWHSLSVMNLYIGRQRLELSNQFNRILNDRTKFTSNSNLIISEIESNLKKKYDEIVKLIDSFYLFMLTEDPLLNSVHFSEYSDLFFEVSKNYNFDSVKNELWKKVETINDLNNRVAREIEYMKVPSLLGENKSWNFLLKILGALGIIALIYLLDYIFKFLPTALQSYTPKKITIVIFIIVLNIVFVLPAIYNSIRDKSKNKK